VVFFSRPFPPDLTLDLFCLGFFAAVVETLLLSAGEGLFLALRGVGAFFFDIGY
jgi:hypothetical protein